MPEIVSQNPVNNPDVKQVNTRSLFHLGAPRLNTYRFGEYSPFDALEIVPNDKNVRMTLKHKLRTYTLGQPLMSKSMLKKDLFFVPMEAILPLNWDKVYTNPVIGDDVDASQVGCTVEKFSEKIGQFFFDYQEYVSNEFDLYPDRVATLDCIIRFLLGAEMFYSNGSLLHALGVKISKQCHTMTKSFDRAFDDYFAACIGHYESWTVTGLSDDPVTVLMDGANPLVGNSIDLRTFLCLARDGFSWTINSVKYRSGKTPIGLQPPYFTFEFREASQQTSDTAVNLARFWAYQIVCAHYYTNDKIDYIYDANLYRQNVQDCLKNVDLALDFSLNDTFTLNGSYYRYDSLSARNFLAVVESVSDFELDIICPVLDYFRLIFGYNRSLRYVDYFTGSKSQPLAVGDVTAAVANNQVSAINVTQSIQKQRFLNAVNRFGRRMSEYVSGLFPGLKQAPDYHNPFFLAHTTDTIGVQEVENTGEAQVSNQNSVTSVLRSDAGQYAFETDFDRAGILIGIMYFDIERAYSDGVERLVQHVDRFDMFNPFLQFVGDQDVRGNEITSIGATESNTFGYQTRYMEYKQRYAQVSGGFVENLPGYAFLADESRISKQIGAFHVSPSFIRSVQTELDKFYLSLTGYSLGSYFHFIVVHDNQLDASRPMAYAPSIL